MAFLVTKGEAWSLCGSPLTSTQCPAIDQYNVKELEQRPTRLPNDVQTNIMEFAGEVDLSLAVEVFRSIDNMQAV